MSIRTCGVIAAVAMLTGCSVTQPKSPLVAHDPLLDQNEGVVLIADVCVQQDALGDADDYFVVTESKASAQALLDASRKYLTDNRVQVRSVLIPFVCGATHDSTNPPQKVADHVNGTVGDARPPFAVTEEIKSDPEYVAALSKMSTYAFQRALTQATEGNSGSNASSQSSVTFVSPDEFKAAATTIAGRTHGSSVLYLGVTGYSQSTGKAVAWGIGGVAVGMLTGIATGGLMFIPIHTSGRQMVAGLVNLESGQLVWSSAVHAGGDPMKAEVVAQPDAVKLLLSNLVHTPVLAQAAAK